jgi:hypothetical protein
MSRVSADPIPATHIYLYGGVMNKKYELETVSGLLVNILEPHEDDIVLNDAAWAISRTSRFSGMTITKIPYNVASHCCFVAKMIFEDTNDPTMALFGLLHDTSEAYISDIPSPLKRIPELKAVIEPIESRILNIMYGKYIGRIPTRDEQEIIKKFDHRALLIEAHNFMHSRGQGWVGHENHKIDFVELQNFPEPVQSVVAYREFMEKYQEYYKQMQSKVKHIEF